MLKSIYQKMTGCIFYACNIYRDTWNSGKLHYISAKKRQKPIAVEINFRCFVAFALSVFKCIFRMCRCPYRGVSRIGFLQRKQKGTKKALLFDVFYYSNYLFFHTDMEGHCKYLPCACLCNFYCRFLES